MTLPYEVQCSEEGETQPEATISLIDSSSSSSHRSKKQRVKEEEQEPFDVSATVSPSQQESSWNFANFKMLTECVATLTGNEDLDDEEEGYTGHREEERKMYQDQDQQSATVLNLPMLPKTGRSIQSNGSNDTTREGSDSGGSNHSNKTNKNKSNNDNETTTTTTTTTTIKSSNNNDNKNNITTTTTTTTTNKGSSKRDCPSNNSGQDLEFVCIIRTSDNCFVPFTSRSYTASPRHVSSVKAEENLLLFSQQLSTALIGAHDLESRPHTGDFENGNTNTVGFCSMTRPKNSDRINGDCDEMNGDEMNGGGSDESNDDGEKTTDPERNSSDGNSSPRPISNSNSDSGISGHQKSKTTSTRPSETGSDDSNGAQKDCSECSEDISYS